MKNAACRTKPTARTVAQNFHQATLDPARIAVIQEKRVEATATVEIRIKATATKNVVSKDATTRVEKKLAKNEVFFGRSLLEQLKKMPLAVDSFEIGFPSGVKVVFKVKHDTKTK